MVDTYSYWKIEKLSVCQISIYEVQTRDQKTFSSVVRLNKMVKSFQCTERILFFSLKLNAKSAYRSFCRVAYHIFNLNGSNLTMVVLKINAYRENTEIGVLVFCFQNWSDLLWEKITTIRIQTVKNYWDLETCRKS